MTEIRIFKQDQNSLFKTCSDFLLARSYSGIQTQSPHSIKGNGGSFFSLSPKNAKHSIHINLTKKNNSETEINFNLSFLDNNIGLAIEYVIMILIILHIIGITVSAAIIAAELGFFFLFVFLVTAAIHLPWWLYNRGKIRKEFWSFVETKIQQIPSYNYRNPFPNYTPKNFYSSNDNTDTYSSSPSLNVPTSKSRECTKCKILVDNKTRFCSQCGNFIQ